MPSCFLAEESVRQRQKIQSAYWASVVQVFWPLMTQLSPSRLAVVRREARSDPAPGSEKPWHHQSSRLAMRGRKRRFCSSLANWAITGPTMLTLNGSGVGTLACCISSWYRYICTGLQSCPPQATGQFGTAQPRSLSTRCDSTISSLDRCLLSPTFWRIEAGTSVRKK